MTAGKELVDGPLVPHDILRVSGEEEVQRYLLREIQQVYRSQRVEINDKHIEIIVARMLCKIKIETAGDTNLLAGMIVDKFDFRKANDAVSKLKNQILRRLGFEEGVIVPKDVFQETNDQLKRKERRLQKVLPGQRRPALSLGITSSRSEFQLYLGGYFQETTSAH